MRAGSVWDREELPVDDVVEIGVFGPRVGEGVGQPLYLKCRIGSGKQTISMTVSREPARIGIGPEHKLIDRPGNDNVAELKTRHTQS